MYFSQAISARNAMAKCLYGAIFDWIVWQINHALFQKQDNKAQKVRLAALCESKICGSKICATEFSGCFFLLMVYNCC